MNPGHAASPPAHAGVFVPRRRPAPALLALLGLSLLGAAAARPVLVGGVPAGPALSTREWAGDTGPEEGLAVWTLPRLGVAVRNDPQDLRLLYAGRELRYRPGQGWHVAPGGAAAHLPAPQLLNGSLHVSLRVLQALGLPLQPGPDAVTVPRPTRVPVGTLPPSRAQPGNAGAGAGSAARDRVQSVRHSAEQARTVRSERVVLELAANGARSGTEPFYQVRQIAGGVALDLPYTAAQPRAEVLEGGSVLLLEPGPTGTSLSLLTGGGQSRVFTLRDPARIVIDTVTYTDRSVPPPIAPQRLPAGVRYRQLGGLGLLSFDPALYRPRVVSAPAGQRQSLAALVRSAGGVAGINGGYFDMQSGYPVDAVVRGGQLLAGSLEKRATLGFTDAGDVLMGYPAPRYRVSAGGQSYRVNAVTPRVKPTYLTAWPADGQTVGGPGLVTLEVVPGRPGVLGVHSGPAVPAPGRLALTFDPARFPGLPATAKAALDAPLDVQLDWGGSDPRWTQARDALSAGPWLLRGGLPVLDAAREGFDTSGSIWRPTHQTAFALLGGWPTFAYLQQGTPEQLLHALRQAGVTDAVRMDSGGSSAVYLGGGYADLGGYLNAQWSRDIPNAVVMMPR